MSLVHVFMLSGGLLLGAAAGFVMHRPATVWPVCSVTCYVS